MLKRELEKENKRLLEKTRTSTLKNEVFMRESSARFNDAMEENIELIEKITHEFKEAKEKNEILSKMLKNSNDEIALLRNTVINQAISLNNATVKGYEDV